MSLSSEVIAAAAASGLALYPSVVPQDASYPYVIYVAEDTDPSAFTWTVKGERNPYWARIVVELWDNQKSSIDGYVSALQDAFHDFTSPSTQRVIYQGQTALADPDTNLYGTKLTFRFYTTEV